MTRIRFSSPGYLETTRRRTVYSPKAYDDLYVPTFVYPRHRIDTTGEENAIRRSVNDELVYTTHVVDDTYDLAAKSRNRDQEILRDANRAIVDTEFYHSPKAAVAARRARSHPPASTVTVTQQTSRLSSVPPRPVVVTAPPPYVRRPRQVVVVSYPKSSLSSASVNESIDKPAKAGGVVPWREYYRTYPRKIFIDLPRGVMQKHMVIRTLGRSFVLPYHRYQYVPYVPLPPYFNTPLEPKPQKAMSPVRVLASPLPYKRKFSRKAALVGNKVEVVLPAGHRKRPKSKYAADVMREINLKKAHETTESVDVTPVETSHMHASSRPVYYESQAKAHWDEYGDVTKPKNLLSWKYRLDARMKPDDLLYQPTTYNTLHSRLRNVHDKMDRHRQLMDRYLDANIRPHTEDVKTRVMSMYVEMEERNPLPPTGASTKLNSDLAESRNTPVRLKTPAPQIPHRLRMSVSRLYDALILCLMRDNSFSNLKRGAGS